MAMPGLFHVYNEKTMWLWLLLLIAIIYVLSPLIRMGWRRRQLYRQYIEPVLEKNGFHLQSIKVPPWRDRGPFPKLQLQSAGLISRVPVGLGSEYQEYRVVQAQDKSGKPVTMWFELHFVPGTLIDIKWKTIEG